MLSGGVSGLSGAARPRAIVALLQRPCRSPSSLAFPAETSVTLPKSRAPRLWIIARGWGARVRQCGPDRRQIFNFLLPGDAIAAGPGAQGPKFEMVALTALQMVPVDEIGDGGDDAGEAGRLDVACRRAAADEVNLVLDHLMRLGQQTALERTAHLLLELGERLAAVHLAQGDSFTLPVKQECLAQALGMSPVHLNRTLQKLKADGLIAMRGAQVTLRQPGRLRRLCDFGCDGQVTMENAQALAV